MRKDSPQPVMMVDLGMINGHRVQGITERATIIIDGKQAVLCTPLEYQLALRLLRSDPGGSLAASHLLRELALDRRSLGDLMTAVRKKVAAPLGLSIASIPRYGYLLVAGPSQKEQERASARGS
jgi:hypothetical protein